MLPKKRRIQRKEFENILKYGQRFNSSHLGIFLVKQELKESLSRFAVSVPKKVFKLATDRNKFRRRGYSVIHKLEKVFPTGFMCLLAFKKGSEKLRFDELESELTKLLYSTGVLI